MNRKLGFLSLAFVALIGMCAYLWLFGKPAAPKENPLKNIDIEKMSRLVIKNNGMTTHLEKKNGVWNVLEPIADVADPSIPAEIINSLKGFRLGSIVSENPARYGEFQLDPAQAAQVEVYVEGQEKPVFSGFVGKTSTGYENCYFRFAVSSGPVYLASSLPQYEFRRDPASFRWTSVLGLPKEEPTRLHLTSGKKSWELSRSSATWTVSSTKVSSGTVVDTQQISNLIRTIRGLTADGFGFGTEPPAELGFDPPATPYLVLSVDDNATVYVLTAGKPVPKKFPQALPTRYVRSSNRSAVLTVQESILAQLVDSFSKLPK